MTFRERYGARDSLGRVGDCIACGGEEDRTAIADARGQPARRIRSHRCAYDAGGFTEVNAAVPTLAPPTTDGRARGRQLAVRMSEPIERRRRKHDRKTERLAKHGRREIDRGDVDQDARAENQARESSEILGQRALVAGRAGKVVVRGRFHPLARDSLEVEDVQRFGCRGHRRANYTGFAPD